MGVLEKAHRASGFGQCSGSGGCGSGSSTGTCSAGHWKGVSEVEAACVMANVSHENGIPLDQQLVFKSIKAV